MKSYIAVASPQPQPAPNSAPSNEVPVNLGTGAAASGLIIASVILTKLSGFVDWKEIGKQWSGSQTSKVLSAENRKTQINEAEIDINQGMSETLSDLARAGVSYSAESNKELLNLLKGSIESAASHAQSTQLLTEAKKHHAEATADIAKAMLHVAEALQSLTQAQEALPREIKLANEVYASEFRVALDSIDVRLEESNKIKREGYTAIHEEIKRAETRIIEQYTGTIAQLRRDLSSLEKLIKAQSPD
jgi:hypothetical protein